MNEANMQTILMSRSLAEKKHELVLPNSRTIFHWEADLLSVTKAGFIHEYEIKLTLSDYNRDKKKQYKHWTLKNLGTGKTPNYFWYVTYNVSLEVEDIPEYAGWIEVSDSTNKWLERPYECQVYKPAPRLHNIKISAKTKDKWARLMSHRMLKYHAKMYSGTEV